MTYTITTTEEADALIAKAAAIKGMTEELFVAEVATKAIVGVAEHVIANKEAADRAAYISAYDAAADKESLRAAVSKVDGP